MSAYCDKSIEIVPIDTVSVFEVKNLIYSLNVTILVSIKFLENFFQGFTLNDLGIQLYRFDCI